MGYNSPGPFVTSTIKLKPDATTMRQKQDRRVQVCLTTDTFEFLTYVLKRQSHPFLTLKLDVSNSMNAPFKNGATASFATSAEDQSSSFEPVWLATPFPLSFYMYMLRFVWGQSTLAAFLVQPHTVQARALLDVSTSFISDHLS